MQERQAVIIITSGFATIHTFFYGCTWILEYCKARLFLFLYLFCLVKSPRRNHYGNSCKLSDPYIYQYILRQILSFPEYIQKCFQDLLLAKQLRRLIVILFNILGSSKLNSLRRLLYSSSIFFVRFAVDKIIIRSISAAEFARVNSSVILYPITGIPLTDN